MAIPEEILAYNRSQAAGDRAICALLAAEIDKALTKAESKIWHRHPVWFLDGNPIAGYSKLKGCIRLLFWSGQSFDEPGLAAEGTFEAAEARYTSVDDVDEKALRRWLKKSKTIQWDYKNIVKRKGKLEPLFAVSEKAPAGENDSAAKRRAPANENSAAKRQPAAAKKEKSKKQSASDERPVAAERRVTKKRSAVKKRRV